MDYYIKIKNSQIPVTEEVYKTYCQGDRKERYFRESDSRNQTLFYDALDTEDLNGSELFWDPAAETVEETAERHWFLERLKQPLEDLNDNEKELLYRLYVYGDSLRSIARAKQIPVTTLQSRHQKLLKKLRKIFDP